MEGREWEREREREREWSRPNTHLPQRCDGSNEIKEVKLRIGQTTQHNTDTDTDTDTLINIEHGTELGQKEKKRTGK